MKTCTRCGETKNVDEFRGDRTKADGLYSMCRDCERQSQSISKAQRKGVRRLDKRYSNAGCKWPEDDKALLWEYRQKMTLKQLANQFKRSPRAIEEQLRLMEKQAESIDDAPEAVLPQPVAYVNGHSSDAATTGDERRNLLLFFFDHGIRIEVPEFAEVFNP